MASVEARAAAIMDDFNAQCPMSGMESPAQQERMSAFDTWLLTHPPEVVAEVRRCFSVQADRVDAAIAQRLVLANELRQQGKLPANWTQMGLNDKDEFVDRP